MKRLVLSLQASRQLRLGSVLWQAWLGLGLGLGLGFGLGFGLGVANRPDHDARELEDDEGGCQREDREEDRLVVGAGAGVGSRVGIGVGAEVSVG